MGMDIAFSTILGSGNAVRSTGNESYQLWVGLFRQGLEHD